MIVEIKKKKVLNDSDHDIEIISLVNWIWLFIEC
jgi:hypothetical protein